MVALGADPFGRRLGQRGMGLERLVKDFDFPSFLIDRLKGISVWVEITTGQIQNTGGIVFVCKDLPMQQDWKRESFDPGGYRRGV